MANVVLATPEILRAATIASGPFAPTTPVSNLLRREPSLPLILTDPDAAWITVDLGADPASIRLLAVLYGNAGTYRVRAAADAADVLADPDFDSGTLTYGSGETGLPHRKGLLHDWLWWDEAKTWRYWRIDFADPDDEDDRTIIGNLVMDSGFQPAINQSYGGGLGLIDPSRKPRAVEGQVEPLNRRPYMGTDFAIEYGTEDEMYGSAFDLDEIAGTTSPVLYLRDPEAAEYRQRKAIFGLFRDLGPITDPFFERHSKRYQIEELLP